MTKHNLIFRGLLVMLAAALVLAMAVPALAAEVIEEPQPMESTGETQPTGDMEVYIDTVRNPDVSDLEPMSGACGAHVTWTLTENTLVISGSGPMEDYTEWNFAPWYAQRHRIYSVEVQSGVTSVGDLAFYQCPSLQSLRLADSVTRIGEIAFAECNALSSVTLGGGIQTIGRSAFENCTSLTAIRFPETLTTLGSQAFFHCTSLIGLILPLSLTELGDNAFSYCINLTYAEIRGPIEVLPYWCFYGCTSLTNLTLPASVERIEDRSLSGCTALNYVDYGGSQEVKDQINEALHNNEYPEDRVSIYASYTQTDHADITTTETYDSKQENGGSTNVSATLTDTQGWSDVVDVVTEAQDSSFVPQTDVYVPNGLVDADTLTNLTGQAGTVTVHTPGNVDWEIRLEDQTKEQLAAKQDLSVTVTKLTRPESPWKEIAGDCDCYLLTIGETTLNATLSVSLGMEQISRVATLYNVRQQAVVSVVVDQQGKASFSLGGTDSGQYLIVLDSPNVTFEEAVIPQSMYSQYGVDFSDGGTLMDAYGNRYSITRNTSALPFTLTQLIVGVVILMIAITIVVGVVMVLMNRKRLEMSMQGVELPEPEIPFFKRRKKDS